MFIKKIILILIFCILTVSLSSCDIEDMNGPDDYSLAVITDEDIIDNHFNSYSSFMLLKSSTHLSGVLSGNYSVAKLSGIDSLGTYGCKNFVIKVEFDFICEEGNAILAIVTDGKIINKIEPNGEKVYEFNNEGDSYKFLIVGESAKISLTYKVSSYN